ncbi:MAG: hypothetical protein EZS28_043101 [Streblomastix strix]|uniref:Tyr recombinase domain-containing protein n=1 Tax=Streblomastix strix TaxID=222440 RepID=A0A5J4TTU5_9EUKA|nr:MAG: hypothetical protein EZS28_043101 [Streblomastix strix]
MTELEFMKQSEMVNGTHYISLKTKLLKENMQPFTQLHLKNVVAFVVQLKIQENGSNKEIQMEFLKIKYVIIRRAGITSPYTGPTIRHAMMTRLRAAGATQAEVNAFTRHAMASNVVDIYYNKPVERDLASKLILNEKRLKLNIFIGHVSKTAWICLQQPGVPVPYAQDVVELENLGEVSTNEENEQDTQ